MFFFAVIGALYLFVHLLFLFILGREELPRRAGSLVVRVKLGRIGHLPDHLASDRLVIVRVAIKHITIRSCVTLRVMVARIDQLLLVDLLLCQT